VTWGLNKWRNDQWSDALESLCSEDQSLWKMMKRVMRVPTLSPLLQGPGGVALSDSEKAEALADSLEAQFQPVDDPSDPAFAEMVDVEMRAYEYAPASEPTLNTPSEVMKAKTGRSPRQPRPVQFLGEPIQWVQTARYLVVTLETRLTLLAHVY
jgi:hypothetical protein